MSRVTELHVEAAVRGSRVPAFHVFSFLSLFVILLTHEVVAFFLRQQLKVGLRMRPEGGVELSSALKMQVDPGLITADSSLPRLGQ